MAPHDDQLQSSPNHLADEKSPYLLQHAHNPVDWYPWGEAAFQKASRENKPVFLSSGYSTCHWCHVMAHECFEDAEIARLLNQSFVCIKVDREERPDIDSLYMTVCQIMTGSGGWPLTILMTPEQKPFFAATYIPKENTGGRTGLHELLPKLVYLWQTRRQDIEQNGQAIAAALNQSTVPDHSVVLGPETLTAALAQLADAFDHDYGGFGQAPKFPTPHNLRFLLRYWRRTGDAKALAMAEQTLAAMRQGGIYDQLGFGFHRYATDQQWLVPHFEKMLYDQAQLALTYTEFWQATQKETYRQTVSEILTYVLRDLAHPDGGFYAAEDADSEGVEGKFYLWSEAELRQRLAPADAELFVAAYGVKSSGNYRAETGGENKGASILYFPKPPAELARQSGLTEEAWRQRLAAIQQLLLPVRARRIRPHRDEKILADWNGLMIAALAKAGWALGDSRFIGAAEQAYDFITENLWSQRKHRWCAGQAAVPAFLDDYAFMLQAMLELYAATYKPGYLAHALTCAHEMIDNFWDRQHGGFFFTGSQAETLLARKKEVYDGALPSGNSEALVSLLRLSRLTGELRFADIARQLAETFAAQVARAPLAFTHFLLGIDFLTGPTQEVIIAGDKSAADIAAMLEILKQGFYPNAVIMLRTADNRAQLDRLAPFTCNYHPLSGKATAYVCHHQSCQQPTTDPARLQVLLAATSSNR